MIGVVGFLTSILAHEFGHALVARRYGVETEGIDLWALGGVARLDQSAENRRDGRDDPPVRGSRPRGAAGAALALLDLLPAPQLRLGITCGGLDPPPQRPVGEYMGMAPNHLLSNSPGNPGQVEFLALLKYPGNKNNME